MLVEPEVGYTDADRWCGHPAVGGHSSAGSGVNRQAAFVYSVRCLPGADSGSQLDEADAGKGCPDGYGYRSRGSPPAGCSLLAWWSCGCAG